MAEQKNAGRGTPQKGSAKVSGGTKKAIRQTIHIQVNENRLR